MDSIVRMSSQLLCVRSLLPFIIYRICQLLLVIIHCIVAAAAFLVVFAIC